ncbi:MAG: hypothetical protein LBS37_08715 [Treponema sp.]|jgi:hypothetical protein|nr:hypothetical protein [Treponema sp.]
MKGLEQDRETVRELAQKVAEIAALPVQEEKKRLWRKLNGRKPERPMVSFDQVCWNELNIEGKLTLRCEDPECRMYEERFRKTLFQWEYFPADMVVEDYIRVAKAISGAPTTVNNIPGALFGMTIREQTLSTDTANDVVSHRYENQFKTIDDVMEKIRMPVIGCDAAETKRRMEKARWLFDGIMPLREEGWGYDAYLSCWDPIAMWMSITDVIYGIIDESEKMHALINRMVEAYMSMLDQLEAQNLIYGYPQALIHTTGAWTDELPAPGYGERNPGTKDLWMYAMAQPLTTVSPAMFEEYEINYLMPLFERFGLVYYGCCEPLELKMKIVKRIPHLRKVSVSPWANRESCAEQLGADYVVSSKPNPAFLAEDSFDGERVRKDLEKTREICKRYGCPVEFIFKDISTVRNDPGRLTEEAGIAMQVAMG